MSRDKAGENEDKLPKWAQAELARLRTDVEHWKRKAFQAANTAPGETNTLVGDGMEHLGLPKSSRVRFLVDVLDEEERGPERRFGFVDAFVNGHGVLELNAGASMAVEPRASNAMHVRLRRG